MTRINKKFRDRSVSPKRPRGPSIKTGTKKDVLPLGYKEHENALINGDKCVFIPKNGYNLK